MSPADIQDLFAGIAPVTTKRMFGGHGIYRDGLIFSFVIKGELFFKADAQTIALFEEAGSTPFVYDHGKGPVTMPYWRVPAEAFDDPDELARFAQLAFDAAARAGPTKRRTTRPRSRCASQKE